MLCLGKRAAPEPGLVNFWLFSAIAVQRPEFSLFRGKVSRVDALLLCLQCRSSGLGKALGGSVQGTEPLVNQGEERFERISRAKFNVDTSDADRQAGCNFKESQTNLADRGSFEFGAS